MEVLKNAQIFQLLYFLWATCPSEKHESVFNIDLFFLVNYLFVKYMKVISTSVL